MPRSSRIHSAATSRVGIAAFSLCCFLLLFRVPLVYCEAVTGSEYDVKLGFIFNFINFVSWPPEAFEDEPERLIFCFDSAHPSSDALYKLEGKKIRGRAIQVIPYQDGACLEQSHVLFFATQDTKRIQQTLDLVEERSILTIGEVDGFTRMGGVINFFEERNRLRFKVNISAARRNRLKMSSQLLGSAEIVREVPE